MKNFKIKLIASIVAILLLVAVILLYNIDKSMNWDSVKIISCILISLWVSFVPQTIIYYFYKIKNSELEYSVKLGYKIGIGAFMGLLFAPYYGIKFYFVDLHKLKYNGEFIL